MLFSVHNSWGQQTQEVTTYSGCQKTELLAKFSSETDNNLGLLSVWDVPQNYYHKIEHWKQLDYKLLL